MKQYRASACPPCPHDVGIKDKVCYYLGIGLGSGMPAHASGTWGSVLGAIIGMMALWWSLWALVALCVLGVLGGGYICGRASVLMSGNINADHDNPHIVFDEWVGVWIALVPVAWFDNWWALGAFVLFRIFDIIKPPPIGWVDRRVQGGVGILLDDVIAGVLSALVLVAIKLVC